MFKIVLFLVCSGLLLYANRKYIPIGSRVEKSNYVPPKPDSVPCSYPTGHWTSEVVRQIMEKHDSASVEYISLAKEAVDDIKEVKLVETIPAAKAYRSARSEIMKQNLFSELAIKHGKSAEDIEAISRVVYRSKKPLAYINDIYNIKLTIDDVLNIISVMEKEKWI